MSHDANAVHPKSILVNQGAASAGRTAITRRAALSGVGGFIAASVASGAVAATAPGESSPIILTVGGEAVTSNRPPFDQDRDPFFHFVNINFTKAFAFSAAYLADLPQRTVEVTDNSNTTTTYTGPLLKDVLAAAGVTSLSKSAKLVALDGYSAELTAADLAQYEWVLALTANDLSLGIGSKGPTFLVRKLAKGDVSDDADHAKWVHSCFYIDV